MMLIGHDIGLAKRMLLLAVAVCLNCSAARAQETRPIQEIDVKDVDARDVDARDVDTQDPDAQDPDAASAPRLGSSAPVLEDNPYAPRGTRVGAFMFYPSIDALGGYTSNVDQAPDNAQSSRFFTVLPELSIRSDWSRHSVVLELRGSYTTYSEAEQQDEGYFAALARAGIEMGSRSVLDLSAGFELTEEDDLTDKVYSAGVALTHRFNRLAVTLRGQLDDYDYDARTTSLGSLAEDNVANYEEREGAVRLTYGMSESLSLFAEGSLNERVFDERVDVNGFLRGSQGYQVTAGASVTASAKVSGEISAGYLEQSPDEASFDHITAFVFDANLTWRPTVLTTVSLSLETDVGETTLAGSPGFVSRKFAVALQHELRRYIILHAGASHERADFEGIDIDEETTEVSAGADYLISHGLALTASAEHKWYDSTVDGSDYQETRISAGIRWRP